MRSNGARIAAAVLITCCLFALGIVTHPGTTTTDVTYGAVPVNFRHYPNHGHATDQMCVFERNHHKYDGSCQNHWHGWVTDMRCADCNGQTDNPPPCHFVIGRVCSMLVHQDFHSWGPPLYSLHLEVKGFFDGYHTWANRTYRGYRGWQRCWVGYAIGAEVHIDACDGVQKFWWIGAYRLQGTDWYYDTTVSLGLPWVPIQSSFRTNTLHWPYPSPVETWVS